MSARLIYKQFNTTERDDEMAYTPCCEQCGNQADCPEGSDLSDGICIPCQKQFAAEAAAEQASEAAMVTALEYDAEAQEDLHGAWC